MAILIQLYVIYISGRLIPQLWVRDKAGATEGIFHPQQYLLILLPLSIKTDFNFKHQSYCFGSRGVVSWAAGVWEGGWGAEGSVSLISLKSCALCLCAGGIPPATLVQSKQAGATSCTTLPNSSPSCQQNETAPTFKHIHVIYSWVIARALPSLTLDDGKGWLHQ